MSADHPLMQVVTISEAADLWRKNPESVRRAIDSRYHPLEARLSGSVWLISVSSLVKRWGAPAGPPVATF